MDLIRREDMMEEKKKKEVGEGSLDKAIALHQKHMDGTVSTSKESQMEMMSMMIAGRREMDAALEKLKEALGNKK